MKVKIKTYRTLEKQDRINFKIFLAKKEMNAVDFCKKIGLSQSYLQLIMKGQRPVTDQLLERFKKAGFDLEKQEN